MPLTDTACRNAKCPQGRPYQRFSDAGGLYLEVSRTGTKCWRRAVEHAGEVVGWDYFVLIDPFRIEMCPGFEPRAVLRVLRERKHLVPDAGRPFDCRARLPGYGQATCYRIRSTVLEDDGAESH